jgi:hypothetical protein
MGHRSRVVRQSPVVLMFLIAAGVEAGLFPRRAAKPEGNLLSARGVSGYPSRRSLRFH